MKIKNQNQQLELTIQTKNYRPARRRVLGAEWFTRMRHLVARAPDWPAYAQVGRRPASLSFRLNGCPSFKAIQGISTHIKAYKGRIFSQPRKRIRP